MQLYFPVPVVFLSMVASNATIKLLRRHPLNIKHKNDKALDFEIMSADSTVCLHKKACVTLPGSWDSFRRMRIWSNRGGNQDQTTHVLIISYRLHMKEQTKIGWW